MLDFSKQFKIVAHASKYVSYAVLVQEGWLIAFSSQKCNKSQLNYMVSESEMLASVHTV